MVNQQNSWFYHCPNTPSAYKPRDQIILSINRAWTPQVSLKGAEPIDGPIRTNCKATATAASDQGDPSVATKGESLAGDCAFFPLLLSCLQLTQSLLKNVFKPTDVQVSRYCFLRDILKPRFSFDLWMTLFRIKWPYLHIYFLKILYAVALVITISEPIVLILELIFYHFKCNARHFHLFPLNLCAGVLNILHLSIL